MRVMTSRTALCGLLFAGSAASQSLTGQIAARLTANDLKADVSFLASDALEGRGTPSPGLDVAAEYIAAQFRRAGLEPAGDEGYFQTARMEVLAPNFEGFEITLGEGEHTYAAAPTDAVLNLSAAVDLNDIPIYKLDLGDSGSIEGLTPGQ